MSDDVHETENTGADETGSHPRPAPARASATSRARRIGGRPMPGPRPAADDSAPRPHQSGRTAAEQKDLTDPSDEVTTRKAWKARKARKAEKALEAEKAPRAEKAEKGEKAPRRTKVEPATAPAATVSLDKSAQQAWPDAEILARRLERTRWIPAGVLAVAAVVLATLCVVLGKGAWWDKPSIGAQRDQVLAAAKSCVAKVTNYDYRSLDASEAAGLSCATGTFKDQYKQAMDTVIKQLAPDSQTVQTFTVAEAGIESISPDHAQWVILVYGQQSVTNKSTGTSGPRLDILSAQVTMNKVGGKWLIATLKSV